MSNLKMKKEHLDCLRPVIMAAVKDINALMASEDAYNQVYTYLGLSPRRYNFDVFYIAVKNYLDKDWVMLNLYSYLNDDNICAAVATITGVK